MDISKTQMRFNCVTFSIITHWKLVDYWDHLNHQDLGTNGIMIKESTYFFLQELKPFYNNKIRTYYQDSSSSRGIETNVAENLRKISLIF